MAMSRFDISQRRACRLVRVDPKTVRREPVPDQPEIRARMRAIAAERRRFGYRRIGLMLQREGITMNHKKLRRLYREEGLAVKRRRGRKRATGTREPMPVPAGPGVRWSLDFLSDGFGDARRFRILAVIDDFTRESLALVADTSVSGARVSPASWIRQSGSTAGRRQSFPTMAASSPAGPCSTGRTGPALPGTTSRPESPSRMPSSRASTAG